MERYFESISMEVSAKYRRISPLIAHSPSIGRFHEEIIATAISTFLSKRFSIKTGFIYNLDNQLKSNQIDIIIVDENYPSPYLFKEKDFCIVFPQAVVCAIEIKSYLGKREFNDIINGSIALRSVCQKCMFMAFAFSSSKNLLYQLDSYYKSISHDHDSLTKYPTQIAIFDRGTLLTAPEKYATPWGHYFIHRPERNPSDFVLTYFLSTIIRYAQFKAGIMNEDPYSSFIKYMLFVEHQCFRFSQGRMEGRVNH